MNEWGRWRAQAVIVAAMSSVILPAWRAATATDAQAALLKPPLGDMPPSLDSASSVSPLQRLVETPLHVPPRGKLPPDRFALLASQGAIGVNDTPQGVTEYHVHWMPTSFFRRPLYFEDVPLERHGHTAQPLLQPAVSAAKFFATIPILPYKLGLDPPHWPIYSLGYTRAGSWAPPVRERLPWSWRGALLEAGAATGVVFLFP